MDKLIGTVLDGRYTIKEVVGTGGMSIVYRAEDSLEDRSVAVKVLKDEFITDQKFRRRFLNESRAIAMLSHPNIVDVVDVNFEGEVQYIVMEYIEGRTIKDVVAERGALPLDEALGYCEQILKALRHAHERGVVHRDIKSQNIMLLKDGNIKVTDFGIAHVSSGDTVTMSELAIGSVHYISPEQARGHQTDEKSDLYSTGIVLYEMITGQLPFDSETAVSVALMQVQQTPKRPSLVRADVPRGLDQIVLHAMEKSPQARYQHAADMLHDLERFEQNPETVFPYDVPAEAGTGTIFLEKVGNDNAMGKTRRKKGMSRARAFRASKRVICAVLGVIFAGVLVFAGIKAMEYFVEALVAEYGEVENFIGDNVDTVLARAETDYADYIFTMEYENNSEPYGTILSQSVDPGKSYAAGSKVEMTFRVSAGPKTTVVPSIIGLSLADAKVKLTQNSLSYNVTTREDKSKAENTVLSCTPEPGETVDVKTTVTVVVSVKSLDADTVAVPNVIGLSNTEAAQKIINEGLNVERKTVYSDTYPEGYIISQEPAPSTMSGKKVAPGTTVTLFISLGPVPQEEPQPPEPPVPSDAQGDE